MELKVWVEGIQRIVCGVNEKTTCQDVVFALAHATGKTGRFTLIERWRNSERLLAPTEQPLKVLLKWGEHSNDVQFILQWSPLETSNTTNKSGQLAGKSPGVESGGSDNSSSHSPSPLLKASSNQHFTESPTTTSTSTLAAGVPRLASSSQINGPKKLLHSGSSSSHTSNDSHPWSQFSQNGPNNSSDIPHNGAIRSPPSAGSTRGISSQQRLSSDRLYNNNGSKLSESLSGKSLADAKISSPPPYREPPSPSSHATPPLISPHTGQNSPAMKSLPPYREPPPPHLANTPGYISKPGNSPVTSPSSVTPVFNGGQTSSNGYVNGGTGGSVNSFIVPNQKDLAKYSAVNSKQDSFPQLPYEGDGWKKEQPNGNNSSNNKNGSAPPKSSQPSRTSNSNSNYRELIRVVNSQREKLTSQQAELTQYDAEIMFWEGKAKEQQKHMDLINKEISRLEVVSAQHESQALSLTHLEEEQEQTQQESLALKSEMNSLRSELERCDDEIEQCKNRISVLVDELHITQNQMAQRQQEWLDKETSTLAEIDRLRKELELARRETDSAKDLSGSLEHEVQTIETTLSEKKKQMERLVAAMKEANLQSLSIQPPEDLIEVHHRSGSTRRMIGSPRQLENAAPTSKNPHGVWV